MRERAGDVLLKNTLLKADHFPGCQNTKLTPLLEGAPNFRQARACCVCGVCVFCCVCEAGHARACMREK